MNNNTATTLAAGRKLLAVAPHDGLERQVMLLNALEVAVCETCAVGLYK